MNIALRPSEEIKIDQLKAQVDELQQMILDLSSKL